MSRKYFPKAWFALVSSAIILLSFSACGSSGAGPVNYSDGTYSGRSSNFDEDENGNGAGYGEVSIKIENNNGVHVQNV